MGKVNRKRGRLEIIYDILKIIRDNDNSIKPTPLLRFSNLSTTGFSEYLTELKEKGLVKELEDKNGRKYITLCDKGFSFLERYRHLKGFIREFNL